MKQFQVWNSNFLNPCQSLSFNRRQLSATFYIYSFVLYKLKIPFLCCLPLNFESWVFSVDFPIMESDESCVISPASSCSLPPTPCALSPSSHPLIPIWVLEQYANIIIGILSAGLPCNIHNYFPCWCFVYNVSILSLYFFSNATPNSLPIIYLSSLIYWDISLSNNFFSYKFLPKPCSLLSLSCA